MILEEATHEAFGYYPSALKPQSQKSILAVCELCGKFRVTSKRSYRTFCYSCSRICSGIFRGGRNPNWKGGLVTCICVECCKEFTTKRHRIKEGLGKYCSKKCSGKSRKGAKNCNWLGGTSFEPYCIKFNEEYKQYIKNLFCNECFLCGKSAKDNGRALDIHHVNYNKDCGCDETKCVCVPLCMRCHSKTNFDRDFWQALIMEMLEHLEAGNWL